MYLLIRGTKHKIRILSPTNQLLAEKLTPLQAFRRICMIASFAPPS